jgi:hypothetical protein
LLQGKSVGDEPSSSQNTNQIDADSCNTTADASLMIPDNNSVPLNGDASL